MTRRRYIATQAFSSLVGPEIRNGMHTGARFKHSLLEAAYFDGRRALADLIAGGRHGFRLR